MNARLHLLTPFRIRFTIPGILPVMTLALSLVAACTGPAPPRHESQTAPGVNLAGYQTFGWSTALAAAGTEAPLRMLDVNIRDALRTELTRRGYREDDANPELRIAWDTAAVEKVRSSPFSVGIGVGGWGGNMGGGVSVDTSGVESYQEGRLVIHVLDAAKNQEVWYGTTTGRVDRGSLDAASVARAVALAMEDFPAQSPAP